MLKNISSLGTVLSKSEQINITGGVGSGYCQLAHEMCHVEHDSDEDYDNCMWGADCNPDDIK